MPYGEVYTALKTGLVDAAENNWPSYERRATSRSRSIYIDHRAFDGAGDAGVLEEGLGQADAKDDQKMIRDAAKESVPYMRKLWDEQEAKSREIVEKPAASQIVDVDKKSFQDAMKPVYAKFITDPKLKDLVQAHPGDEVDALSVASATPATARAGASRRRSRREPRSHVSAPHAAHAHALQRRRSRGAA